jgi:hypothetical protein
MLLPPDPAEVPQTRKHLSFDPLVEQIRARADKFPDPGSRKGTFTTADAVMSGLAMFALKDPSLLAFQQRRNDQNMKAIFRIDEVPSDTRMREILDPIPPDELRPMFNDIFRQLQRGKALESFVFEDGHYLLSLDGTEYFSSNTVHCASCQRRTNKSTGEVTYYHQLLGAVLVHPDHKEVIPLAPEPIVKQDGDSKNDCERNASKRLLEKIRKEHPHLQLIVVEDGLASNAPHIRFLRTQNMRFLLGAKPDDHEYLFEEVIAAYQENRVTTISWNDEENPDVLCEVSFLHDVPLNKSNPDLLVNFLQYIEYGPDSHRRKQFTWVTDLTITTENARHLARGGRARWKIENETFNTLKNQGYHFEHNYGHGEQYLSVVFAMLMMLAFLIDQTQQLCCPLFRAVMKKVGTKRLLWERIRSHFYHFVFRSMRELQEAVLYDRVKEVTTFTPLQAALLYCTVPPG